MATKLTLTVEVELAKRDIIDPATLKEDLEGELVKVKSGAYENMFYGNIAKVEIQ